MPVNRSRLSDGERETLAELERLARPSAGDIDDLLESADCLEDVLGELLDAANYSPDDCGPPCEWMPREESDDDETIPY